MEKIKAESLTKEFKSGDRKLVALEDVSFNVEEEELLCILGPTGCGKTTLLRLVAGLDSPTEGKLFFDGNLITGPGPDRMIVFQEIDQLFPWLTVEKNIDFVLKALNLPEEERSKSVRNHVSLVGLQGFEHRYPYQLSGGMRQKAAIARALAMNPEVLLMDEPFGSLDAHTRTYMQNEFLKIWQKAKKTVLFVTHNIEEAAYLADRVLVLTARPGRLKKDYDVQCKRPRNRWSREFSKAVKDLGALIDKPSMMSLTTVGEDFAT